MSNRKKKGDITSVSPAIRKAGVSGSTKFEWRYRYVNDGQLEPDEHGRWAIDCYMFVHIDKALDRKQTKIKQKPLTRVACPRKG